MRFLLYALLVGFLFMWGVENIPDFMGYLIVGVFVILGVRMLKEKKD